MMRYKRLAPELQRRLDNLIWFALFLVLAFVFCALAFALSLVLGYVLLPFFHVC